MINNRRHCHHPYEPTDHHVPCNFKYHRKATAGVVNRSLGPWISCRHALNCQCATTLQFKESATAMGSGVKPHKKTQRDGNAFHAAYVHWSLTWHLHDDFLSGYKKPQKRMNNSVKTTLGGLTLKHQRRFDLLIGDGTSSTLFEIVEKLCWCVWRD